MRSLKAQYFCGFAVMGSVVPFLPVFLKARGLDDFLLSVVIATTGVAIMVTPVLITLLADLRFESRSLIAAAFGLGLAGLLSLWLAEGFIALLLSYALFALGFWPLLPLQDGLNFAMRRHRVDAGESDVPYHHIRVWGTMGFIVPSVLLWRFLRLDWSIGIVLWSGMFFCVVGFLVTRFLPHVRQPKQAEPEAEPEPAAAHAEPAAAEADEPASLDPPERTKRLPTIEAARRILFERELLLFALGMWLIHLAASAYYTFYPRYLTDANLASLQLGNEWLGPIANLGVVIEIFFMLGFGWFMRHWGLRWLMTIGALAMGVRMALLYALPTVPIAVGTQLLHGITVLVLHVAPPVFINHHAEPRYRNSMQGVYAMGVFGTGRLVGYIAAGLVAKWSLLGVFAYGTVLCVLSMPLFYLAFHRDDAAPVQP
jgi:PPP family 3-phenylpropionic acid transporter